MVWLEEKEISYGNEISLSQHVSFHENTILYLFLYLYFFGKQSYLYEGGTFYISHHEPG